MTQTPKRKQKKRTHLPSLTPEQLFAMTQQMAKTHLSNAVQRQIEMTLKAASAPGGESIEAGIRSLPPDRQTDVQAGIQEMKTRFTGSVQRGNQALLAMSDTEWNRLVEESASD